jgi:phosphate starvation-inducible PhoH-like protein
VARAVEALEASDVRRIILVRPAVEAGEKLGFLPGDMSEKIDPYLRLLWQVIMRAGFDCHFNIVNFNGMASA